MAEVKSPTTPGGSGRRSIVSRQKTGKRELAIGLLLFWGCITTAAVWAAIFTPDVQAELLVTLSTTLSFPIIAFAAAAYGMDWYARQGAQDMRTQYSNYYPQDPYYSPPYSQQQNGVEAQAGYPNVRAP